jgi:hypothetical protein
MTSRIVMKTNSHIAILALRLITDAFMVGLVQLATFVEE